MVNGAAVVTAASLAWETARINILEALFCSVVRASQALTFYIMFTRHV